MNNFDLLKCCICSCSLVEFVVLACNHTICGQCFSRCGQSGANFNVIDCPCGLTTNIPKERNYDRKSILQPSSSIPSMKKNKSSILDQSTFTIFQGSKTSLTPGKNLKSIFHDHNSPKSQKHLNITNYLVNQLDNQIKLVQLRFKRYLNQINRCYNKLISQISKRYEQIIQCVASKCKAKIKINQINSLADIQHYVQKIWKPNIQIKLIKISNQFTKLVDFCSADTSGNKQNNFNLINCQTSSKKQQKKSTHMICKRQNFDYFLSPIKPTTKQSKIKKKRIPKI